MEEFFCEFNVFICLLFVGRILGGVVWCMCEVFLVVEVVGFDVVLIEIVGVG